MWGGGERREEKKERTETGRGRQEWNTKQGDDKHIHTLKQKDEPRTAQTGRLEMRFRSPRHSSEYEGLNTKSLRA